MKKKLYTSEITDFLREIDDTLESNSKAQQAEKEKYASINEKRDNPDYQEKKSKLWQGF